MDGLIATIVLWSGTALLSHGYGRGHGHAGGHGRGLARRPPPTVMAGPMPAMHDFSPRPKNSVLLPAQVVDGRDKPGHDGGAGLTSAKTAGTNSFPRCLNRARELRRKSA